MKKVFKFVKGGKKDGDGSAAARKDVAVAGIPASCSNDSLNNNGYHMDIYGADKGMNKLHKSAYQGNMDKLKLALKCTDIDTVDEMSRTALHFAITQRHTNIVWFLLNNKARMDIMDKDGFTAFHKAVQCGNTDCTHLMLERGADIDSTDDNGNTALHLATRQGYFNIAALLLKKGADLSIFNNQGEVPLHIATLGEHKELVSLLLKYGAAVNVPDRLQRTPLMLAARVGNIQLIHIFLQHGSHLDCCDSNGWTASDYAMIGGHQEIAKQLAQIPRPKTSMSTEKLDMLDTIGEDSELSDVDTSLDPNINNNSEVEHQIEVSIVSKKDISAHDSPLSCVTPPPLKPPRSWDLIQSGMIDTQNATVNNNTVQKRKSLTTLGSLESRRDSFVDNSNIASTPVEEPANDNGVIAENAMRNGTTTAENAMRNGTTTAENAMRNGTKAAENAMRGTEMGYSTEVACTGVVGEMKNIDGTDVGVHNKQPEEVTNVLDENNRNKGDSAKHMEDTNEDDIDTSLSSNSSSLLNELANNILVNQINKVVVDNQVSDDENVDTVNETGIAVVSGETVLGKTNDAKMESSRAGEAMEITRDVVKQGRAFFEKKTNSEEVLNNKNNSTTTNSSSNKNNNNNNTTTDSNNIAVKSKNTNEFAKDTEIVRAEELHLEPDSFVFNNERDEEIQMMILQNNLKEHRQFLIEKLDDVKSNEPCSSGMKSKELAEDSTKPDSNDGVETIEIEPEQHVEKALRDLPKAIDEVKEDKRIHSGSEMNNQAPSDVDTDMKMVSASSNIADIPPSKLCDNFNSNPLMESIDTTCPPLSDTDAVHQYLASIQTDVSQSLESSNKVDSTVCSSCVGTTNESCDLMNKSCDYLINNIDQVLEHINSNANDVIQQNELLETHLSNELLETQLSKELLETHLSNELLETHLSNELLETHLSKELLETHLSNELLETHLSNELLETHLSKELLETHLSNELLETHLSNELLETHLSNEPINKEHSEEASDTEDTYSDEETLGNLQDEKLLRNAMKHLPRHKSLDLSDDSMPYIASPKVKDAPGPNVHLFDELPPPPSDFQFPLPPSNLLDDQPSSASLVSLDNLPLPPYDSSSPPGNKSGANLPLGAPEDNLPLPPDDMLERLDTQCSIDSIQDDEDMLEEGGFCTGGGEKQLACIEEEETVSEMSNCKEIPYKNMEDYSVDEDDDGNRTPTNEDPGPLCNHEESRPPSHNAQDYKIDIHFADTESLEKCYVFVTERGSKDDGLHETCSESCEEERNAQPQHHQCSNENDYQLHSVLDENNLVVEVNMNSSEGGGETHSHPCHNCRGDSHSSQCTEFHSYRDYAYSLSEQNDGSRIKDQLACYDRAIEELSINPQHHHSFPQNGGSFQQNGGSFPQNGAHECNRPRTYGENKIHELIDKDLKCLSDQLLSEKHQMYHELYSSGDSVNRSPGDSDLDRLLSSEDKKRKLLVSMTNIDLADEDKGGEDSGEEGDPPFWASEEGGGGGRFSCVRQNTVIYNEDKSAVSSPNQGQGCIREDSMSTTSSSDPSENHRNTTPKHLNPLKSTTSILRETTLERGRLEEAVGVLRSRVEVLEYQLADATQSLALKSDTVSALEETVAKHEATIAHHLALVNTLSYQNQNYQAEINHLTSLYTKDESVDRIAQLEASTVNLKKKIDYLNAQVNSLSEENIVLHEFIANIDSEEGRNLNIPASFKMMKKQNFLPQTSTASNVNQSHNIPQEIYDDILNLKLNLEKEVMLRKKLEEEYSIELGRKLQDMEIKHAEELKKQEQCLRKEKVLKIDAELRHKKELDLERQILLHEITKLKSELKNRELHIVKMETQLRAYESDKKLARKQLIDSVNREIAETSE